MHSNPELRNGMLKIILFTLLAFFLLPGITLLFTGHVEQKNDRAFLAYQLQEIDADASMPAAEKEERRAFLRAHPLSELYDGTSPGSVVIREQLLKPFSFAWQFHLMRKVASWMLIAGAATLVIILLLGAIAFQNRRAQYPSFTLGWNLLTLVSAGGMLVQGVFAVWLAFWLPAFFFERYSPKLILVIGLAAGLAVLAAIINIFKRPREANTVQGELLANDDAPALWTHICALAEKLGIPPPQQIIAGIDDNFFVTEAPLQVGERQVTGRSLFISLPLLRLLEQDEADAVFMHELAHLYGGDTASSARLGPKLMQYDQYCAAMGGSAFTRIVYFPMVLYRLIFEFALQRDNREREHQADRAAVQQVSARGLVQALIKISAYSAYRAATEQQIFSQSMKIDGSIGIAGIVAAGLPDYATSSTFLSAMQTANVPHPFHSHPPLAARMQEAGCLVEESRFGEVVTQAPEHSWVQDIATAGEIEDRLWSVYEQAFASAHEQMLAYRYQPVTDEELAIVLKYFPPVVFPLKGEKSVEVTYAGLQATETDGLLAWDDVHGMEYKDGIGGDVLVVALTEKKTLGRKTVKIHLSGLGKQKDAFKTTVGKYWQRHQIMRQGTLNTKTPEEAVN